MPDDLTTPAATPAETPQERPTTPLPLKLAAAVMVVQALAFAAVGLWTGVNTHLSRAIVGIGSMLFLVAWAILLVVAARGIARTQRWWRGPVAAVELIHLPVAWSFNGPQTMPVFLALGLSSLAVLVALLLPASTRALAPRLEIFEDKTSELR